MTRIVSRGLTAVIVTLVTTAGCAHDPTARQVSDAVTAAPANDGQRVVKEIAVGPGTACSVDGALGPPSYLVRDLGRPGVPRLDARDAAMARTIATYVHSKYLRFAYPGNHFIVFNAVHGPCELNAPGYAVLNGRCNMMYSPTDNFDGPRAVPQCWSAPRPWMPPGERP